MVRSCAPAGNILGMCTHFILRPGAVRLRPGRTWPALALVWRIAEDQLGRRASARARVPELASG